MYGVELVRSHANKLYGIKLQASVLQNNEVWTALGSISLEALSLMINVSGFELSQIETFLNRFICGSVEE